MGERRDEDRKTAGIAPTLATPGASAPPAKRSSAPAPGAETKPSFLAMTECMTCHESTPVARFCTACGASLAKRRFCSDCGARLTPDTLFCEACGAKVPTLRPS